ncbi:DUF1684 domain-containing protein [Pseudoroseicyclus aestuarii]|uniref:DUF1684 domain-containing protein n=1 Tax=Pseudoroseicyclus aestuarii TaxID=1795041 RepID=A0A318SSR9_9RHOB|nr:DUF1684 domain-containing protein [Pseudoroseicyclus aestuarii]PYE84870.1 hypothetical protein DFP88_102674 [Pseudoroseicyclus aestuarii]
MPAAETFRQAHADWREARMEKLTAETGWLNLLGRWWVTPGTWTIGSAPGSDIRLPEGPELLGRLVLETPDSGSFLSAEGAEIPIDRASGRTSWQAGRFALEIAALNDWRALRVRDRHSAAAEALAPIPHFPLDPALRITASWEALPQALALTQDTVVGLPIRVQATHVARLELQGESLALLATHGTAERPQFVFRDLTSKDDTYAPMRFVFGEEVTDGSVVIDFNRAINPPSAFTPHALCPLPPRENLLFTRIEAGERRLSR